MSARFWLFSCVCAGAALTGGFGLGLYATTPPRPGTETVLPEAAPPEGTDHDLTSTDLTGPAIIHCEGCGPTLADRQMAADMEGWDGMNDPAVQDYAAQDEAIQADYVDPPAPAQTTAAVIEPSSANVPQPIRIVQAQPFAPDSKTPAEEIPAGAAVSY